MGVTSLGRHTRPACTQGFTRSLKLCEKCGFNSCVRVFFISWGHVSNHAHIWAIVTSISHMGEMRDSDWSREILLRSDWLPPIVAICTTEICGTNSALTSSNTRMKPKTYRLRAQSCHKKSTLIHSFALRRSNNSFREHSLRLEIGGIKAFKKGVLYHGENCNRGQKNDPRILEPPSLLVNR